MKIAVAGVSYVGLSLAVLLVQKNEVRVVTTTPAKAEMIKRWESPIHDDEIKRFFSEAACSERALDMAATADRDAAYAWADMVVVATPASYDDEGLFFDASAMEGVIERTLAANSDATSVIKSTIPVGYTDHVRERYDIENVDFSLEFLRESKALYDNLHPPRIVAGTHEGIRGEAELFCPPARKGCRGGQPVDSIPLRVLHPTETEAVKPFTNAYLVVRVAYFNEVDAYA